MTNVYMFVRVSFFSFLYLSALKPFTVCGWLRDSRKKEGINYLNNDGRTRESTASFKTSGRPAGFLECLSHYDVSTISPQHPHLSIVYIYYSFLISKKIWYIGTFDILTFSKICLLNIYNILGYIIVTCD